MKYLSPAMPCVASRYPLRESAVREARGEFHCAMQEPRPLAVDDLLATRTA